ncbi:hypothetical protein Pmani_023207 [Petrolisthes manimaculis]|uniref:Spectrin alpha chain-like protein n=1 Tax=Petrolisthes manimaculis TaxID=1843537 RepID=A0AAE1PAD5_9EUCA|nr:hypothetical protein Pmani_023207 [Petrolisthes manimaculis]
MVKDFENTGHSQLDKIRMRQKQIHDLWAHLNRLKQQKERSLEGASSVEVFHCTSNETRDWMVEKMDKLDTDELGRDFKTVQSLQHKHHQLERELAPVEEKVKAVERRNRLEETVGQQMFLNSAKSLVNWVGEVNADEPARDVTTVEHLLKSHQDLDDDIRAHQEE